MDTIWMGIDPGPCETRVLVMEGPDRALLKARLSALPSSRAALPTLLEAIALWQGRRVHAALAVDGSGSCARARFAREVVDRTCSPLYRLEFATADRPRRRGDGLSGLGAFGDLRDLLVAEAMR